MMPKLIGNPNGERDTKPFDDRHYVLRNTDRLVRHVRIIHTYAARISTRLVKTTSPETPERTTGLGAGRRTDPDCTNEQDEP